MAYAKKCCNNLTFAYFLVINTYLITLCLVPSSPTSPSECNEIEETTSICVGWKKPKGGQEINEYELEWQKQSSNKMESDSTPHYVNTDFYEYTISELQPGERVTVAITASNSAGTSQPTGINYASRK